MCDMSDILAGEHLVDFEDMRNVIVSEIACYNLQD